MAKTTRYFVLLALLLALAIPSVDAWAGGAAKDEAFGEGSLTVEGMT